jgi:perosamine synthetase
VKPFPYALIRRLAVPQNGTRPLISATLGLDDVEIARQQLKMRETWLNPAPVEDYEKAFANWNGSAQAFAFMGARVALSACIHALRLKPGDEVIIPGYTCVVVANAFHYAGVKVTYKDIELETYGLDASTLKDVITSNTKAVLLHHLYGLVCRDYEKTVTVAREHGLFVIEDCAQATGATCKGRKSAT